MKGSIYKITNKINGKIYIGQTRQLPQQRWWQHQNLAKRLNKPLIISYAINKYGIENFVFEVIETNIELSNLSKREEEYIISLSQQGYELYNVCTVIDDVYLCSKELRYKRSETSKSKMKDENYKNNFIQKSAETRRNSLTSKSTSGYVGVHRKKDDKWTATINLEGKRKYLGSFSSEVEAAQTVDKAALYYFGNDFNKLNFPNKIEQYQNENYSPNGIKKDTPVGVSFLKSCNRWRVRIKGKGDKYFHTKESALDYYNSQ